MEQKTLGLHNLTLDVQSHEATNHMSEKYVCLPAAHCHKIYYLAQQVLSCVIENSVPTSLVRLDYNADGFHPSCTSHTGSSVAQEEMYLQESLSDTQSH